MNRMRWLSIFIICLLGVGGVLVSSGVFASEKPAVEVRKGSAEPLPARYIGKTVLTTSEPLVLRLFPGPDLNPEDMAFLDFEWSLDGQVVSTSSELALTPLTAGEYTVELRYHDLAEKVYKSTIEVQVLQPEEYDTMMAAVHAAANLPLWLEDDELFLFLPLVEK